MPKNRARRRRYRPLAPSFKTRRQYRKAINRRAEAQVQPLLQDVEQRGQEAERAHASRVNELQGMYGNAQTAAQAAQERLRESLTGLLGSTSGYAGDATAGLNAALRKSAEVEGAQANALGVSAPGTDPGYAQYLAALGGGNQMGLTGDIAGMLTRSAAESGIRGVEGREAGEAELRRFAGLQEGLGEERSDIMARIPALREAARAAINEEEMSKQNARFQQLLAQKQFGLSKKQFRLQKRGQGFQERLAKKQFKAEERQRKHQRAIDWANVGLNRTQLRDARNQVATQAAIDLQNAQTEAQVQEAKTRAKRFDNAATWLESYLKPTDTDYRYNDDGKKVLSDKKYTARVDFAQAMSTIRARFGMGQRAALLVMRTAPNPGWQKQAAKLLVQLKEDKAHRKKVRAGDPMTEPHE